jgi:hypothetical protein
MEIIKKVYRSIRWIRLIILKMIHKKVHHRKYEYLLCYLQKELLTRVYNINKFRSKYKNPNLLVSVNKKEKFFI